jgi:branched-chain amino acid transport system ATP-binding protein
VADLLEMNGIAARYGPIPALSGVSLKVPDGSVVALLGSNGAGKTTTLNVISRLVDTTSGEVLLNGEAIHGLPSNEVVKRGIVQVPQGREIFRDMSVRENLEMGAYLRRDGAGIRADFTRVCDYFPRLRERLKQKALTLSGGEQQMLLIARALMARPKLLLLDEPSLGLSPLLVQQIFQIIHRLHQEGLTILVVEQNARVALSASSYAYILENGEVVLEGRSADLIDDDNVHRTYLGV